MYVGAARERALSGVLVLTGPCTWQNELTALYNPFFQRFLDLRQKLDPQNIFVNSYLRELLFPMATY
jgi:hypothetical protein